MCMQLFAPDDVTGVVKPRLVQGKCFFEGKVARLYETLKRTRILFKHIKIPVGITFVFHFQMHQHSFYISMGPLDSYLLSKLLLLPILIGPIGTLKKMPPR